MRAGGRLVVALVVAAVLAAPAWSASTLERRIYQSFVAGDYPRAAALIERYLAETPGDAVMLYNAACAHTLMGRLETGASYLRRAVEAGLDDAHQITSDPDLAALRDHPTYIDIVRRLDRPAPGLRDAQDEWRALYGDDHYRYYRDDDRSIAYATALDPVAHREMVSMIERQVDYLHATLFDASPSPYLLVAVPAPGDGRRLFGNDQTGGMYEHERRRVISRDIGASLRHEITHAMHYAHMELVRQRHPLWVQEGVATLFESYVLGDDGSITFLPNERHNSVYGLARAGRLTSWRDLFKMSDEAFMADASRLYPQVRSIFEFLADQGLLVRWYNELLESYDADPTGARAFRDTFGEPLSDIERSWRRWVLSRDPIDMTIDLGEAVLGVETRPHASNDGVLITALLPGSAAAKSRLDVGDVIVSVNERPTRTLAELRAVIAARKVGDSVSVRARRDREYFTINVVLEAMRPIIW